MQNHAASSVQLVLLASPRGWCAGVDRAVEMVEQELDGSRQVYMRHAIVHNNAVTTELAHRGARVVEDLTLIPAGATMVISAHGSPPWIRPDAQAHGLTVVDATCPLVKKVHTEVRRYAKAGYTVLLIAHRGHVEAIGTMGEAPDAVVLVETAADVEEVCVADPDRVAWVCQTTLSMTDAATVADAIRARFPNAVEPRHDDICYATTNRQNAVVEVARRSDLVLVIGSPASSNSRRLVERAREQGCRAQLVEECAAISAELLADARVVGISSGASTPEHLVTETVAWFRRVHSARVEEVSVAVEDVRFLAPPHTAAAEG